MSSSDARKYLTTLHRRLDYLEQEGARRQQLGSDHPAMREAAALRWAIHTLESFTDGSL